MSEARISWRIPAIDGFRALACLMVYVYHVWQFAGSPALDVAIFGTPVNVFRPIWEFPAGVDLFMVLSGFCLFWPLCKNPEALARWNWREYGRRRVRRIVPPYYMAIAYAIVLPLALVAAFRVLGLEANWPQLPSPWQIGTHVLFIHTLFPSMWYGITGAFWSLGLEAQFYLVFPLVVACFRRFRLAALAVMVLVSIVYRIAASAVTAHDDFNVQMVASIFFLGRWMQFAAGMAAAWFVAAHWRGQRILKGWVGSMLVVLAVGLYVLATTPMASMVPLFPLRDLLIAAAGGVAIFGICASRTPFQGLFGNRLVAGFGFISYSVFLIHQPTAWYISEFLRKWLHVGGTAHFALLCTIGLAVVCAISYGFFLLFEKPFLTSKQTHKPAIVPSRADRPAPSEAAA